jgi:tripartite-type tricarboxylate transporter receptor subunit TctC
MTIETSLSRRAALRGGFALSATLAMPSLVRAQGLPAGPIQIIVGYGAGGGTDSLARLMAPSLQKVLNRPVTVQNVPGGGGQVGATTVLRDGQDGLAILALNEPDLFMGTVFAAPPYKHSDFQIIMVDLVDPRVMLVQQDSPINTLADFVAKAKAEPGKLAVSVAQGSAQELLAKWLFAKLGVQVRIVGYPGGAQAANALLAGDVVANIGDDFARFNLRSKTKALFVGAQNKSPRWPEAQTLTFAASPLGLTVPSTEFLSRYGIYAVPAAFKAKNPAGYAQLQAALIEARKAPEFQAYIEKNKLADLSLGKPGEELQGTLAQDFKEIAALK